MCGLVSHDRMFQTASEKRGNNQGTITVPERSLCGFLLHRVPRKSLKFRLGLHSTPTRFRHIYQASNRLGEWRVGKSGQQSLIGSRLVKITLHAPRMTSPHRLPESLPPLFGGDLWRSGGAVKAEGARVPGAGIWPEAVPGKMSGGKRLATELGRSA